MARSSNKWQFTLLHASGFALLTVMFIYAALDAARWTLATTAGVVTQGTITQKWATRSGYVDIEYSVGGQAYDLTTAVMQSFYDSVSEGDTIEVRYWLANPRVARLANDADNTATSWLVRLSLVCSGPLDFLVGALLWFQFTDWRRRRKRHAQVANA